ncbi:hypothetical protein VNO77_23171 [Canavalia gladiata]|uniref:Uncharacterized protein n=1 Tax=Canavalia gladiata TaxID=3824 RepID=A0AAN9L4U8_CANGL
MHALTALTPRAKGKKDFETVPYIEQQDLNNLEEVVAFAGIDPIHIGFLNDCGLVAQLAVPILHVSGPCLPALQFGRPANLVHRNRMGQNVHHQFGPC